MSDVILKHISIGNILQNGRPTYLSNISRTLCSLEFTQVNLIRTFARCRIERARVISYVYLKSFVKKYK